MPKVDNSVLFKEAYSVLERSGSLCIFPEGTSHDRSDFIKLKVGFAVIGLGAQLKHKKLGRESLKNVRIVPVGLSYFRREQFRSDGIIEFGVPYEITDKDLEKYERNKFQTTDELVKEIETRMKCITLRAETTTELKSLSFIKKIFMSMEAWNLLPIDTSTKKFLSAYENIKDSKITRKIVSEVSNYMQETERLGLSDYEIRTMEFDYNVLMKHVILSFLVFHFFLVFSLPGIVIMWPFVFFIRRKAEEERIKALAKNPNKIEAKDVVSSVKIVYFIIALPLVTLTFVLAFFWFAHYTRILQLLGCLNTLVLSLVCFPIYAYFCVVVVDYILFYLQTMYSRFLYFVFPKKISHLKELRIKIETRVVSFITEYMMEEEDDVLLLGQSQRKSSMIKKNSINMRNERDKEKKLRALKRLDLLLI